MFWKSEQEISKVFNPLKIASTSLIEFTVGELAHTGMHKFKKIIEMNVGDRKYSRYLILSNTDDIESVFEVFPGSAEALECYVYSLTDTIPFTKDFLQVAGQKYITTPGGDEYLRCVMPELEDRIDGVTGKAKIYDIDADIIENEISVTIWDYSRIVDEREEYLNIEMSGQNGMFRIFNGEMLEEIFFKIYKGAD